MATYTLTAANEGSSVRESANDVLDVAPASIGTREKPPRKRLGPDVGGVRERSVPEESAVDDVLEIVRRRIVSESPVAQNFYQLKGFEGVKVAIVDEEGNLVEEAAYAYSVTPLRTRAELENGVGRILLNTAFAYSEFVVIGESNRGAADFAWQTIGELQEPINSLRDDTATIVIDPQRISGLYAGERTSMGGSLG